jgi:hypothetical protein
MSVERKVLVTPETKAYAFDAPPWLKNDIRAGWTIIAEREVPDIDPEVERLAKALEHPCDVNACLICKVHEIEAAAMLRKLGRKEGKA